MSYTYKATLQLGIHHVFILLQVATYEQGSHQTIETTVKQQTERGEHHGEKSIIDRCTCCYL